MSERNIFLEEKLETSAMLFFCIFFLTAFHISSSAEEAKTHIVYLGHADLSLQPDEIVDSHVLLLAKILGSKDAANNALIYNYKHGFSGFAANLTEQQAQSLSESSSVVSIFPSGIKVLHTTESWRFLGLSTGNYDNHDMESSFLWKKTQYGKDVIIGSVDTGIWPESKSFSDHGMGPVPKRWRGSCDPGFKCNRKIIGARHFIDDRFADNTILRTPRDTDGHGSRTASIAAGRFVPNISIDGHGNGTAKGGAPMARLAIYKACWEYGYTEAAILAAIDQAIYDGVDILTLSLGTGIVIWPFFLEGTALGAFHAIEHGISVVTSAGNDGPRLGTVNNLAPWLLTVAASTTDREFSAEVVLGNNAIYKGVSVSKKKLDLRSYPLVASKDVYSSTSNTTLAELCLTDSLDPKQVRGKIVACMCDGIKCYYKGIVVSKAGGTGIILYNAPFLGEEVIVDTHVLLPAVQVSYSAAKSILSYISITDHPTAYISAPVTKLNVKPSPRVARFSSVGPNTLAPDVLKPDVTAPGVNILAAHTEAKGVEDSRPYNMDSGTSFSCPHVTGIVALLKAYRPHWSPAAIKSALTTTAYVIDNTNHTLLSQYQMEKATPLHYGGGHVNPDAAAHPGLIYDASVEDYIQFLCSIGYDWKTIRHISHQVVSCPSSMRPVSALNLPSITLSNLTRAESVTRTATNVGDKTSIYRATVEAPANVSVAVHPSTLNFSKVGQKLSFTVTFDLTCSPGSCGSDFVFGSLTWKDHKHSVRTPLTVRAGY